MGRPHRTDFPGAIHHVIARCDNREPWALDNGDYGVLQWFVERAALRYRWRVLAYCVMRNHYHLLVQTPEATLSKGMHLLNRGFAGWFNYKYRRVGHVFEDRYIAILVQDDLHLARSFRYVLRNPVAARIVVDPADWPWSSARVVVGRVLPVPDWIDWQPVASVIGGAANVLPYLYAGDDDRLEAHELHHANTRPPLEALQLAIDDPSGIARAHYLHLHRVDDIAAFLGVGRDRIYRALRLHAEQGRHAA
jgi:REP element-mobilizing transposase RayT